MQPIWPENWTKFLIKWRLRWQDHSRYGTCRWTTQHGAKVGGMGQYMYRHRKYHNRETKKKAGLEEYRIPQNLRSDQAMGLLFANFYGSQQSPGSTNIMTIESTRSQRCWMRNWSATTGDCVYIGRLGSRDNRQFKPVQVTPSISNKLKRIQWTQLGSHGNLDQTSRYSHFHAKQPSKAGIRIS